MLASIDALARSWHTTRSDAVKRILRNHIDTEKGAAAAFSNPVVAGAFAKAFSQPGVLRAMSEAIVDSVDDEQMELFNKGLESLAASGVINTAAKRRKGKK